jgi:hypothetical protein
MFKKIKVQRNSQQDIVDYLKTTRFMTESEIQEDVWGYKRGESRESNKKYADILRRAYYSGKIKRVRMKIHGVDKRMVFRYYINYI